MFKRHARERLKDVAYVSSVICDTVKGNAVIVRIARYSGIKALVDISSHKRRFVGKVGFNKAVAVCIVIFGIFGVDLVRVADEFAHSIAVHYIYVSAAFVSVVLCVGALVKIFVSKSNRYKKLVGVIVERDSVLITTVVDKFLNRRKIGRLSLVIADIRGTVDKAFVAMGKCYRYFFARMQNIRYLGYRAALIFGIGGKSQSSCASAGIAVLVVYPRAKTKPFNFGQRKSEDLPFLTVLGVIAVSRLNGDSWVCVKVPANVCYDTAKIKSVKSLDRFGDLCLLFIKSEVVIVVIAVNNLEWAVVLIDNILHNATSVQKVFMNYSFSPVSVYSLISIAASFALLNFPFVLSKYWMLLRSIKRN